MLAATYLAAVRIHAHRHTVPSSVASAKLVHRIVVPRKERAAFVENVPDRIGVVLPPRPVRWDDAKADGEPTVN